MKKTLLHGRLLDGAPYIPSHETDIRKLFARVRKELAEKEKSKVVTPMKRKTA